MSGVTQQQSCSAAGLADGLLSRAVAAVREMRARGMAVRDLSLLTDRQLADIGISRYDIGRIARGERIER
jgi:uncharacterized protein YjiS (DUF1127 family)